MFEGFSFPSHPASPPPTTAIENDSNLASNTDLISPHQCDSTRISPLSSRCPSPMPAPMNSLDFPRLSRRRKSQYQLPNLGPAPTSIPPTYSDPNDMRLLARRLNAQSLEPDIGSDSDDGFGLPITPPRSTYIDNEARDADGLDAGPNQYNDDSYTSFPSHEAPGRFPGTMDLDRDPDLETCGVRYEREKLSLLQCASSTVSDTLRLALLLDPELDHRDKLCGLDDSCAEDQHPSSLPPSRGPSQRQRSAKRPPSSYARGSKKGSAGTSNTSTITPTVAGNRSKVDKTYNYSAGASTGTNGAVGKYNRSACGLRRKSLVIAAVAAVLEQDAVRQG